MVLCWPLARSSELIEQKMVVFWLIISVDIVNQWLVKDWELLKGVLLVILKLAKVNLTVLVQ